MSSKRSNSKRSSSRRQRKQTGAPVKAVQLDSLKQINRDAAGLDIGAEEIYACVPEDRDAQPVRCFGTFTADLYALADWLASCGVKTVAMESTGVYWVPVFDILEQRGFEVLLVNARQVKNVSGRKSDVLDCQWLQQLHTYGLLRASFRPEESVRALRTLIRQREMLLQARASHIQHMQKALTQMDVLLTTVLSDITGLTGMQIIRAILAGERDPHTLATFRDANCKKSVAEIAQALNGHYTDEQVFVLRQSVEEYDFYTQQLKALDGEIQKGYTRFEVQVDVAAQPLPPRKDRRRKPARNEPAFDLRTCLYQMAGVDLCAIDGLNSLTVQVIVSEVGLDLSPWPTVKHFTSWLGLAPDNQVSGGKVLKRGTKQAPNRAAGAFRLGAATVRNSDSEIGAFYRRVRARHGAAVAITATAHKLARIVYFMLKNHTAYYDRGANSYDEKYRQRAIRNLARKAQQLGLQLTPSQA